MATPITAAQTDDNDKDKRRLKKGRNIKPLNEDELKKLIANDEQTILENNDILAELAAKTAKLAEQVKGVESPEARALTLDEHVNMEPKDIFEDLNGIAENSQTNKPTELNPAVNLIRQKLNKLYQSEPDAATEAAESLAITTRSKHQQMMYEITTSGKSLAEIQTEWHNYYVALPNDEKHEVWQEFYQNHSKVSKLAEHNRSIEKIKTAHNDNKQPSAIESSFNNQVLPETSQDIKSKILNSVSAGGKLKPVHHIKSLLFGLGLSSIAMLFIVFVFFNQVFVAPLISPSQSVSATPILGDLNGPVDPEPKIIIPKINLEVPVVFGLNTIEEEEIQKGLESGVVHYSSTPNPGQIGNSVIVGHSSNNILNSGKYKFAFVLLRRLEIGDVFYLNKDSVRYSYKIYDKKVVTPDDVSVLGDAERDNSMTLITCDPPGTSRNRLIIIAEQISPDPISNTAAAPTLEAENTTALPSNAPSLLSRLWPF